jgi:hypothetical protein
MNPLRKEDEEDEILRFLVSMDVASGELRVTDVALRWKPFATDGFSVVRFLPKRSSPVALIDAAQMLASDWLLETNQYLLLYCFFLNVLC